MLESWIVPFAILSVFAVLLLAPLIELTLATVRSRTFHCPWADRRVSVETLDRSAFGISRPVRVCSCSAFGAGEPLTCDQGCLTLPTATH